MINERTITTCMKLAIFDKQNLAAMNIKLPKHNTLGAA